jgi:hypothetical protein
MNLKDLAKIGLVVIVAIAVYNLVVAPMLAKKDESGL